MLYFFFMYKDLWKTTREVDLEMARAQAVQLPSLRRQIQSGKDLSGDVVIRCIADSCL